MNKQTPKAKPLGRCPFCYKKIRATILVKNKFRRDMCKCPNCEKIIYVCRNFVCKNYAAGGKYYDFELCPRCAAFILIILEATG